MENNDFTELEKLFYGVMHLHHKRAHMLMESSGLHPRQPVTLFLINNNQGLNQRELAEMLKIQPASISVVLQRLEKSGMIERRQDEQDQRITRVYITEQGKQELTVGMKALKALNDEAFANLSQQDKDNLYEILKKISGNLSVGCKEDHCKKNRQE
jgi:DNA-binding MarR family transcriptional regulator